MKRNRASCFIIKFYNCLANDIPNFLPTLLCTHIRTSIAGNAPIERALAITHLCGCIAFGGLLLLYQQQTEIQP